MAGASQAQVWRVVGVGTGLGAGFLARKVLERAWRSVRGEDPPGNPAAPTTGWGEALVWAAASGVALAVARLVAQRGAAEAWRMATGDYPEDLDALSP
jgi:hypothetical protein